MKNPADFTHLAGTSYPEVEAVNESAPGFLDGTPYTKDIVNELWGAFQAILHSKRLTPSGVVEKATLNGDQKDNSQIFEAMVFFFGERSVENAYYDGGGIPGIWKYSSNGPAFLAYRAGGVEYKYTAVSGTADTAITWVLQSQLDANKLTLNGIVHKNYNNGEILSAVYDYDSLTAVQTGAIEIVLPNFSVQHMISMRVRLRSHHSTVNSDCDIKISGFIESGAHNWQSSINNHDVVIVGKYQQTPSVKFGRRLIGGFYRPTLIIGDAVGFADTFGYLKVQIIEISNSHYDFNAAWMNRANYSISVITALAGDYENRYDIIPSVYGPNAKIAGNLEVAGNTKIDDWIELSVGGVSYGLMQVTSGGLVRIYSNAYLDTGVAKLRLAGSSTIKTFAQGAVTQHLFTGAADATIVIANDNIDLRTSDIYAGKDRLADGAVNIRLITAAGEAVYNALLQKSAGANGILKLINKGTGALQLLTNDTVLGLSQDQNGQVKANASTASTSTTTGALVATGGVGIGGALYVGENINLVAGKAIINQWFVDDSDTINDLAVTGLTNGTWLVFVSGISIGNSGTDVILIREGGSVGTIKATLEDAGTAPIKASNFAVISGTSFYIDIVNSAQRVMVAWTRIA